MWSSKSLSEKTVSELKDIAKSRDIKGYYKMRKKELIQSLSNELVKEIDPTSMEQIRKMLRGEPRIFELRKIAKKMGISFKRNMKKAELEDRIKRSLIRHEKAEQRSESASGLPGSHQQAINPGKPVIPVLPKTYGKDKLVALPVNPLWIHIYWDFSEQTTALIRKLEIKGEKLLLRIYDVTYIEFNGHNAHQLWEYVIPFNGERKFYANVNNPNASYIGEIGYINENGEFVTLLRSNLVRTPPNTFAVKNEEKWLDLSSNYEFSKPAIGVLARPKLKAVGSSSMVPKDFGQFTITSGGGSFLSLNEKGFEYNGGEE
ncbi:MAG TPA: DUF4912 domain-containing protein [Thermotogota bacterium]|nr:DUF4912 domain-containing protein [Thermotogota bacterium]HPJ88246.1 DUF4912 domain-containing protein [Thermotogota bacterium]HPR96095.1 DUF4912 domain-containing protein [Thermotogota bacterium]